MTPKTVSGIVTSMKVTRLETWTTRIPLKTPLRLGGMTVDHREYIFVRATGDGGHTGAAWSLTRNLPVGAVVDSLAPRVVGSDLEAIAGTWQGIHGSNGPAARSGVSMRALSLTDIALWDLRSQAAGMPLYQLLGGLREEMPVIAVSGYPGTGKSPEEMGDRLTQLARDGHALVKAARWPTPDETARLLARTAAPGIIIDAAWAWESPRQALDEILLWGEKRLAWLEDAMPPQRTASLRELRENCPQPLGVGDEVSDPDLLTGLVAAGAVDLLRVDATVAGGITGVRQLLGFCWHSGIPVSFHVGLPIHIHLAASSPAPIGVEAFVGEDIDLDPVERLLADPPPVENGRVVVPTGPGLGCSPDWEQITTTAHLKTDFLHQAESN